MSEWQPIETIDGEDWRTRIFWLDWADDCVALNPPMEHEDMNRLFIGKRRNWASIYKATHWMPLPAPPTDGMSLTPKDLIDGLLSDGDTQVLEAAIAAYGEDASAILNGFHSLAARVAIAAGIDPEHFAAGMKHHWDYVANGIMRKTG
jgi:hypothetical protein